MTVATPAGPAVAVVVLAGGTSRRWGGGDKTAELVDSVPLLARAVGGSLLGLLDAGSRPAAVVVVAPSEHPARPAVEALVHPLPVVWAREDPPGGGPVAGLAAGLAAGAAAARTAGRVLVVAGDLPFPRTAVPRLLAASLAPSSAGGRSAVAVDPGGRLQPLLAVYVTAHLAAALAARPAHGRALRDVLPGLPVVRVPVDDREALDLDTPGDLAAALRAGLSGS